MSVIAPSILAHTKEEFDGIVARLAPFAKRVHIDLMDGQLAPSISVPIEEITLPEAWQVDMHVMFAEPENSIKDIIALKPSCIIIHAESQGDLLKVMKTVQSANIKAGIALLRSTVPEDVSHYIKAADHVLIFSGNLGQYGGIANMLQIEKTRLVRAINPEVEIGWDGGANVSNAYTLALSGVEVINVGKALVEGANPAELFRQLDFEVHRKDVLQNQASQNPKPGQEIQQPKAGG